MRAVAPVSSKSADFAIEETSSVLKAEELAIKALGRFLKVSLEDLKIDCKILYKTSSIMNTIQQCRCERLTEQAALSRRVIERNTQMREEREKREMESRLLLNYTVS
ncbi:unnamed protein product [Anisakis simplex]|uniref:Prohibitin n=1 Tax=Anisakis simplex TaxID=6269 RepID=A0A0M3JJ82_ANISI|nr:unnamed protein product [Anisakis simplex]